MSAEEIATDRLERRSKEIEKLDPKAKQQITQLRDSFIALASSAALLAELQGALSYEKFVKQLARRDLGERIASLRKVNNVPRCSSPKRRACHRRPCRPMRWDGCHPGVCAAGGGQYAVGVAR